MPGRACQRLGLKLGKTCECEGRRRAHARGRLAWCWCSKPETHAPSIERTPDSTCPHPQGLISDFSRGRATVAGWRAIWPGLPALINPKLNFTCHDKCRFNSRISSKPSLSFYTTVVHKAGINRKMKSAAPI